MRKLLSFIGGLISLTAHAVTFAWDPSVGASGYRLYYGVATHTYTNVIDTLTSTSNKVSNLVPGRTYFFVVTAYNSLGIESAPSNEIQFTSALLPPANLRILPDVIEMQIQNGPTIYGPWKPIESQGFYRGVIISPD